MRPRAVGRGPLLSRTMRRMCVALCVARRLRLSGCFCARLRGRCAAVHDLLEVVFARHELVLNEIIHECQRSLEAIGHAKVDLEAREWARGQGLKG